MPQPTFYMAVTEPINPSGVTPVLTKAQVWKCLHHKVRHAEEFVGGAIKSTEVISETKDDAGRDVITRWTIFSDGDRKTKEVCTFYDGVKVDFLMTDGSRVLNILSQSSDGSLYLTYEFNWVMPEDTPVETQEENKSKWTKMSATAVSGSVDAMRAMVKDGRIQ